MLSSKLSDFSCDTNHSLIAISAAFPKSKSSSFVNSLYRPVDKITATHLFFFNIVIGAVLALDNTELKLCLACVDDMVFIQCISVLLNCKYIFYMILYI